MDALFLLSLGVFAIATVDFFTNYRQWISIKHVNLRIQEIAQKFESAVTRWTENGTLGQQINDWIMAKEKEGDPTNVEIIASMVGRSIFSSMNASVKGEMSGESRRQSAVDRQVFEAVKQANPELTLLAKGLERLGLGDLAEPDTLPLAMKALRKYGISLDSLIGQNNNGGQMAPNHQGKNPFQVE